MSKKPSFFDLHLHTEFSPDSTIPLEAYAQLAEQLEIHVGFLDHFELAFFNRPNYLNYETLPRLLESFDQTKANYPNVSLGLEVDYYSDEASGVAEFCDDFRNDFNYLIGTVHVIGGFAITTLDELRVLVSRIGLPSTIERYFTEVEGAIRSKLFDGIAHIDGVMRFVPLYPSDTSLNEIWQRRTLELGGLCQRTGVLIEVNLRGLNHPWGKMHPSQSLIEELVQAGAHFYVGSDSHSLRDFEEAAPKLRQVHLYLREHGGFRLPASLGALLDG
ncbi:MAG: histidinol-phosphatase HisJ family protein [Promethearchaeota archaeon]